MNRPGISTGTGDNGETALLTGKRVSKASARLHAIGSVDELAACLGVVLVEELPSPLRDQLLSIQRALFRVGADLAVPIGGKVPVKRVEAEQVRELEEWSLALERLLPKLQRFILPAGSRVAALLHQARAVCRRGERWVAALRETEQVNGHLLTYLNRLSDYLFLAAREVNRAQGIADSVV
ncbi:MAG: cob(I)yrinic acid a,c-diamide adenosyltransferase [Candidatus Peribacteraceae bacterium]|nr:cob(I)yrinic acid a,c-diamide adenosyltransferase [Candidatus Peribacteraceae bacterium]